MKRRISILATIFVAEVIRVDGSTVQETVIVAKADCSRYVVYVPDPDVAYKPGVDVKGNKVAPAAFTPGPKIEILKEITIDITVELQERFGLPSTKNV